MTVLLQVQIYVGGLSVQSYNEGNVRLCHHQSIQEEMDQSALVYSIVSWICGSVLLMCSRKLSFFIVSLTTQVDHIPLPYSWGMLNCVNDLDYKVLHVEVATMGIMGDPMAAFCNCSKNLP